MREVRLDVPEEAGVSAIPLADLPFRPPTRRGASHPNAKLNDVQVNEIRSRLARGERGAKLARDYGVSHALVSSIKVGKGWKYGTPAPAGPGASDCSAREEKI